MLLISENLFELIVSAKKTEKIDRRNASSEISHDIDFFAGFQ